MELQLSRQHINAYHLSQSLLFQFILSETLAAYGEVRSITHALPISKEENLQHIYHALSQLLGSFHENIHAHAWNPNDGTLAKLKSYCAYFGHHADLSDKKSLAIHRSASQAWLECWQCLDTMLFIDEHPNNIQLIGELERGLFKCIKAIHRLGKLVLIKIDDFSTDENVLFFLLRHKEEIDSIFGQHYVRKLFMKLFPKGLPQAHKLLTQKYAKRGFTQLLPIIEEKFTDLGSS